MFKKIRIIVLLLILASVSSTVLLQKSITHDWQGSLDIRIIPVIADQKQQTSSFVNTLKARQFQNIERYLIAQGKHYKLNLNNSLNIQLEAPISNIPPTAPQTDASRLSIILWSLKLKWWAWQNQLNDHHIAQVRIYILYQSPDDGISLPHSTGLQNGLIGLVNARAIGTRRSLHQVIITHELLHIFGASDKYSLESGEAIYPNGYADPNKKPLYPQIKAEIMGRSIPLNATQSEIARSLSQTIIGKTTAAEIGWVNADTN